MEIFLEFIKSIVFGIVEGISEWLPISSTGHMIILQQFFGFANVEGLPSESFDAFINFFLVVIQLGAIFAVVLGFFKELWPFGKNISAKQKREIWLTWEKILIASIPAAVIGLLFDDLFEQYLYGYLTVSITLIVYGIAFILIETALWQRALGIKKRYHLNRESGTAFEEDEHGRSLEDSMTNYPLFRTKSVSKMTIQMAMVIGLAQVLALIPGTSRSGVTICAALLLSIDRPTAAKFSFYLSIPAMLGGSLIKGVKHFTSGGMLSGLQIGLILVGMAVAFAVSFVVIRFFMKLIRTHTFVGFGIYRVAFGALLMILYFAYIKNLPIVEDIAHTGAAILPSINQGLLPNITIKNLFNSL